MIWRDAMAQPYGTRYEVSDHGDVRNKETGSILKQRINRRTGYSQIVLTAQGQRRNFNVHRLVLEAFQPKRPKNKNDVNHKNEIKTDNRLINLEWVSRKENIHYGTHTQRQTRSLLFVKPEKNSCKVIIHRKDGAEVLVTSYRQAAKWTGINRSWITNHIDDGRLKRSQFGVFCFYKACKLVK